LDAPLVGVGCEQQVLEVLDLLVQLLDRLEMSVHHVVQQSMQEEGHTMGGQVGPGVPAVQDLGDVEPVVLADGDQCTRGQEGGQLAGDQLSGAGVEADGVRGQERVVGVTVQLGPLVRVDGVFDRQGVQLELAGDQRPLIGLGCYEVDPDHRARFPEVFGDLVGVEVGVGEDTVSVAAGAGHTATVMGDA
jgi:hypothetical protein